MEKQCLYSTLNNKKGKLKVLYFTHPAAFNVAGGAEIQLLKTKEYIERKGCCSIKLFDIFKDKVDQFDILHNFSLHRECLTLCKTAKLKKVKIALSPVYWKSSEFLIKGPASLKERISGSLLTLFFRFSKFASRLEMFRTVFNPVHKELLELADIILPNSRMEMSLLMDEFGISEEKFHVVPNGVDKEFFGAKPDTFVKQYNLEDFVLYVGRIAPVKNLLTLLQAYKDINIPLVIIGNAYPIRACQKYFEACKKTTGSNTNVHFLGFIPHDSELLRSAYAAAKVFVLPSWFETTGLVALEAGLTDCNIVITNRGSSTEYFRDYVWYVDPSSKKDIREKILEAYQTPKNSELRNFILRNYTWEGVAEKTIKAYRLIMDEKLCSTNPSYMGKCMEEMESRRMG